MTNAERTLEQLLRAAREASLNDRIDYRNDVARLGEPAIEALEDWLTDPELCRFALRAIGRAGQLGARESAIGALVGGRERVSPSVQSEIDHELTCLGYQPSKADVPSRASSPRRKPMDVGDVGELFYIVSVDNVGSIVNAGILSHARTRFKGYESIASAEVQALRGRRPGPAGRSLHTFANLYICQRNPMMYVVTRARPVEGICVLRVNPDVLNLDGVFIADGNAATGITEFKSAPEGLTMVDKERVHASTWNHADPVERARHKREKCAEVLVPDFVVPDQIIGAFVPTEGAAGPLRSIMGGVDVSVAPFVFFL